MNIRIFHLFVSLEINFFFLSKGVLFSEHLFLVS